jgi:ankyrin repeat protein
MQKYLASFFFAASFILLSSLASSGEILKTPLIAAAFEASGHESPQSLAALEQLLKQKVDVHEKGYKGSTALFTAVDESRKGQSKAVEMLLKAGANPNDFFIVGKDIYIYTLADAVRLKNMPVVKLLLQYKADPNDKEGPNTGHSSALKLAKQLKLVEFEKILRDAGAKD